MFPPQPWRLAEACSSKKHGSRGQKCQTTPGQTSKYIPAVTTSGVSNWQEEEAEGEEEGEEGSSLKAPNHSVEPCCHAALVVGCFTLTFGVSKLASDLTELKRFPRPSGFQLSNGSSMSLRCSQLFPSRSLSRVSVTSPAHAVLLSWNAAKKQKKTKKQTVGLPPRTVSLNSQLGGFHEVFLFSLSPFNETGAAAL